MKDSKKYLIVNRWISSAFNSFAWVAFSLKCTPIILKYPFRSVFLSKIPGLPQYWSPPLSLWHGTWWFFFWGGGGRAGAELHYVDIVPASFPPRNWKSKCQPWFVRSLTLLPQIYMKPYSQPQGNHPSQQPLQHSHKPLSPAFFRTEQPVRTGNDRARSQECVKSV